MSGNEHSPTIPEQDGRDSAPEEKLGRYPVTGRLGAGGMGDVLEVLDPELGRKVAAKVARGEMDARQLQKFILEARITGLLEHPSIIPLHELASTADGRAFFTMKRVAGDDLAARVAALREGRSQTTRIELINIFLKICDAISFAHSRRVIHRDLKPANVMVGEFGEVQVMDWGLAKLLDSDKHEDVGASALIPDRAGAEGPARTLDGAVLGTPAYMPPEQADGRINELDERADIYALGAILYELLTLQPPYVGRTAWQVIALVSEARLVPPTERAPEREIPWELEAVILRAMTREPSKRYASVAELRADVDRYLQGGLLRAARYSPWQRLRKWAGRHRAPLLTATAVLIALIAAAGVSAIRDKRDRDAAVARADAILDEQQASATALADAARRVALNKAAPEDAAVLANRERRAAALDGALEAIALLGPVLAQAPDHEQARAQRRRAGLRVGFLALGGGEYTFARRAFMELGRYGLSAAKVDRLTQLSHTARTREMARRMRRLEEMLTDIGAGLGREVRPPGRPTIDDYTFEAVSYRDRQTVARMARVLDEIAAREASLTTAQTDEARLACRVLGRIGLPGALSPLVRYSERERDPELLVEVGLGLCLTGRRQAYQPLLSIRKRLNRYSTMWKRVQRAFGRVPAPEAGSGSEVTRDDLMARAARYFEAGEYARAVADLDEVLRRRPRSSAALHDRAIAQSRLGRKQQALSDANRAIELAPTPNAIYHNTRGALLLDAGRLDDARKDLERAVELEPAFHLALGNLGRLHLKQNQLEAAVRYLSSALEIQERPHTLIDRAQAYYHDAQIARAAADIERALALDPDRADAYVLRGLIKRQTQPEAAEADFRTAIVKQPRFARAHMQLGALLVGAGRLVEAKRSLNAALQIEPRMVEALRWRAEASYKARQKELALSDLTQAIELDPGTARDFFLRGNIYLELKRVAPALADLDRGLAIQPDHPHGLTMRARCLLLLGRAAEALPSVERALRLDAEQYRAHAVHGQVLDGLKRYTEAAAALGRAIERQPDHASAYYNRASVLAKLRDHAGVIRDANRAIELRPRYAAAWAIRAQSKQFLRDLPGAEKDYRRCIELDPEHYGALINLANIHARRGEKEEALVLARRARKHAPARYHPLIDRTIAKLEGK